MLVTATLGRVGKKRKIQRRVRVKRIQKERNRQDKAKNLPASTAKNRDNVQKKCPKKRL